MLADRIKKISRVFMGCFAWALLIGLLASCSQPSVATTPEGPTNAIEDDSFISTQAVACKAYSYTGPSSGTKTSAVMTPGSLVSAISIPCPLGSCTIVDFFGARLNGTGARMHYGIDLRGGIGTAVRAVATGKIIRVRYQAGTYSIENPVSAQDVASRETKARAAGAKGAGLYLVLLHDNGYATMYGHLDPKTLANPFGINLAKFNPTKPIRVTKGQRIAVVGQTGNTVPHLHLEYARNGAEYARTKSFGNTRIDPLGCLESVNPVIKVVSPTTRPLQMTADAGKSVTNKFVLSNSSTDEILLENTTVSNSPTVVVTNPKPIYIGKGNATTTAKKDLNVKGTCPTSSSGFIGSGTVRTKYYKSLGDTAHTRAWPLPTSLVAPNGIVPKPADRAVKLNCNFNEIAGEYIAKFTLRYTGTDVEQHDRYPEVHCPNDGGLATITRTWVEEASATFIIYMYNGGGFRDISFEGATYKSTHTEEMVYPGGTDLTVKTFNGTPHSTMPSSLEGGVWFEGLQHVNRTVTHCGQTSKQSYDEYNELGASFLWDAATLSGSITDTSGMGTEVGTWQLTRR
jgi:murein DD-endopeptidase MepM/ murein hydrolase activator NlpD